MDESPEAINAEPDGGNSELLDESISFDFDEDFRDIHGTNTEQTSTDMSHLSPNDDFDNIDILADFGFDGTEETEEDSILDVEYIELTTKLQSLGYDTQDLSIETMRSLNGRIPESLEEENEAISSFAKVQGLSVISTIKSIRDSSATLLSTNSKSATKIAKMTNGSVNVLGSDLHNIVNKFVQAYVIDNENPSVDGCWSDFMNARSPIDNRVTANGEAIYAAIGTLLPMYKKLQQHTISVEERVQIDRSNIAQYLLRDEAAGVNSVLNGNKDKRYVRQIFSVNDKYYTKCPVCGEHIEIAQPMLNILEYVSENGQRVNNSNINTKITYFMNGIVCTNEQCNTVLVLTPDEYNIIYKQKLDSCGSGINNFMESAATKSKGAAILRVGVSAAEVGNTLPYIFVENDTADVIHEDVEMKPAIFCDADMQDAIRKFYFKLHGMTPITLNGSASATNNANDAVTDDCTERRTALEYREDVTIHNTMKKACMASNWSIHDTAVFVTQYLSKDYHVEHNQALFSLVMMIKNNPVLKHYLSLHDIWDLQIVIRFLENSANLKLANVESNAQLLDAIKAVTQFIDGNTEVLDKDSASDLLKHLSNNLPQLRDKCTAMITARNQALDCMYEFHEGFSYTPVVKFNSIQYSELCNFMGDSKAVIVFNEIADEMIVRAYADKYFKVWEPVVAKFNATGYSTLNKRLVESANVQKISASVNRILDKFGAVHTQSEMQNVYSWSKEDAVLLQHLRKSVVSGNFYRFCINICKFNSDVFVPCVPSSILSCMCAVTLKGVAEDLVAGYSEAEFYLKEDFSLEEIHSCAAVRRLQFGRFIPCRLENESINDYCTRIMNWNGVIAPEIPVRDNLKRFLEMTDDVQFWVCLGCSSLPYDANFNNYNISIFTSAFLLDAVYRNDTKENVSDWIAKHLGVSKMHQNIIKSVPLSVICFDRPDLVYALTHGIYSIDSANSIYQFGSDIDNLQVKSITSNEDVIERSSLQSILPRILGIVLEQRGEESEDVSSEALNEIRSNLGLQDDEFLKLTADRQRWGK